MVTRDELITARELREYVEQQRKEKARNEYEQFKREQLRRDEIAAESLLLGKLGVVIQKCDTENYRCLRLNGRVIEVRRMGEYTWYSDTTPIPFAPNPDYPPTKILTDKLKEAGFEFELTTVQEQNTKVEFYGDGEYNVVEVGGTHPVYWLEIRW